MKKAPVIYDKAMHEARKYWRDRLHSISFDGYLALDHPRPKDGIPQISSLDYSLDQDVSALLQRLTGGNHFLLYTALVLALRVCCYKYSGTPKVTIFCPGNGDGPASLLPVGGIVDRESSFKAALLETRELLSNAYQYQQYPFSRLLLDLPDQNRPNHLSVIAALAGFNNKIPDSQSDLVIVFETTDGEIKATTRFDARLYSESTVLNFLKSLSAILRQGLGQMATRIVDLRPDCAEGSGSREGAELSSPGPVGVEAVPGAGAEGGILVHHFIEARATNQPESQAVVEGSRVTTYKTLNDDADRLAATLADLNLDLRKPIVILMDAGTEMIVSTLAVMKIGGVFAPLKLLSIGGQITELLEALGCECIVCQREQLGDFQQFRNSVTGIEYAITVEYLEPPGGDTVSTLDIGRNRIASPPDGQGRDRAAVQRAPNIEQAGGGTGRRTACVLVSTNEDGPAISQVTHAELSSLIRWLNGRCEVGSRDRCLLSPGLGSGDQLYDTLGMLAAGASLEVPDASSLRDPRLLAERLLAESITVWDLPTALTQNLLSHLVALREQREGKGPANILLSGEKQSPRLAERLTRCFPNARITGLFSNSAIGIWSTAFLLNEDPAASNGAVIAQSIPGFELRVLNKIGEPAPLHTKGELHLVGLLSTPEAASNPGTIATGLRGELLDGGRATWLRDEDHSFVKYECRVELTKIEEVLCHHEHILAAEVITIRVEPDGPSIVVAFLIAEPDKVTAEAARDFLVLHGEVDLIPDRFILLDEFPLRADGAIDRRVLIKRFMASHEPKDDAGSIEAEEIHRQLRTIWLECLQVDDVDDNESFFARGGNSLKATLLIARIKDKFSVDLSVQDFFRKPSTRAVAKLIEAESKITRNRQKGPDFKAVPREKYRVQLSETET